MIKCRIHKVCGIFLSRDFVVDFVVDFYVHLSVDFVRACCAYAV
ncbi:hypothetical protein HMPREF1576_00899 [Gardnerella pickettii JCP7719]|uniref:Uncharacterized protein n=2 Tax=Gardnerella pickettii TaxID=2914924 RepID=T2PJF9_9BIFI|nr:hypothetical protein HMPREF1586_00222 [Gardnerella vaginalis JCP8522]EPI50604.1 hypothetical protein HMPREF1576_00899 [Gardnerella pickettii JCP7719]EPI51317.1 hypothetical protein HMPREF1577_01140 [Gardnerella pickettii JCP8017A]EPI59960.1 hypothetical protein HMPREF1578_01215 [Gardnerella pickettii JCP8017B]